MRRIVPGSWKEKLLTALLVAAAALGGCAPAPAQPAVEALAATATPLPPAPAGDADAGADASADAGAPEGLAAPASASAPTGAGDAASATIPPAADTGTPAALALAAPSELLDSYRVAASLVITSLLPGGEVHIASTQVAGDWVRSAGPFGFDVAYTLRNSSGDQRQELNVVAIEDDAAMRTEGVWSTIRRDDDLLYSGPDSLLSLPFVARINSGENLGRENLGGVPVTHYRLTDPAVFAAVMQDRLPSGSGTVQSVLLEGWVADAGFVVKYLLQVTLAGAEFVDAAGNRLTVQQQIDASYLLSDIDAVRAIEWPADAQPPDTIAVPGFVPNTFPLPEGSTATPLLGMVEIRTPQPEAEVVAFYRARLAELGWSFEGELGFYTAGKDGQVINLTILRDEVNGDTQVRVFGASEP
jgi:hypothetical protein